MSPSLILMLTGCLVGKAKYDTLLGDYTQLQADNAALQSEYAQLEADSAAALNEAESEITSLTEALANAEAESANLQEQIDALNAEKASLLKDKTALKGSVKEMEDALMELARRKAAADARVAEFRDLLDRFKALIDAGKLKVKIVDGRMVVELATDVLFSSGSADLSKDGEAALIEVSGVLASIPDRRYQVEGHTDDDPIQTAQYPSNWELASGRALVVTKTDRKSVV